MDSQRAARAQLMRAFIDTNLRATRLDQRESDQYARVLHWLINPLLAP